MMFNRFNTGNNQQFGQPNGQPNIPPGHQLMSVTCPPNVFAGNLLNIQTPSGLMRITVPNGVRPGQAFQVAVPSQPRAQPVPMAVPTPVQPFMPNTNTIVQQQYKPVRQMPQTQQQQKTVSITIPKGCKPGNTITVNLPTGKAVKVTIPHGMHPGNKLTVNCKRQCVLPRQCAGVCLVDHAASFKNVRTTS